ncbi:MAG: hypothetical protein R3310_08145, partial [Candidatus Competibacteraceae bacterium]|nr:hypothetical protein [Candidatus Competibacteraceae bacterium]
MTPLPSRIPEQKTLARRARRILDAYLAARLEELLKAADFPALERQRRLFLERFGPEALARLSDAQLPDCLPLNPQAHQPLDYWLEYKADPLFDTRRFGGLKGGSAAKFGVWRDQQGQWRSRAPGQRGIQAVSPQQALAVLASRRREMLAAAQALTPLAALAAGQRVPAELQAALDQAAPRWGHSAWLHKYLHLVHPGLVTWWASLPWLRAGLYRLGEPAGERGLYALDGAIGRVWAALPALAELAPWQRYRLGEGLGPRPHWCLRLTGEATRMVAEGWLGLGSEGIEGLAGIYSLTRQRERRAGIEAALQGAGLGAEPRLGHDLLALGEVGGVVALVDGDSGAVVAVGEVAGAYRHQPGQLRPHRIGVHWAWSGAFAPAETPDFRP